MYMYRGHIDLDTQVGYVYIYYSPPINPPPNPFAMLLAFPQFFLSREHYVPEISDMYFDDFYVFF
jgi:hypothetical protein